MLLCSNLLWRPESFVSLSSTAGSPDILANGGGQRPAIVGTVYSPSRGIRLFAPFRPVSYSSGLKARTATASQWLRSTTRSGSGNGRNLSRNRRTYGIRCRCATRPAAKLWHDIVVCSPMCPRVVRESFWSVAHPSVKFTSHRLCHCHRRHKKATPKRPNDHRAVSKRSFLPVSNWLDFPRHHTQVTFLRGANVSRHFGHGLTRCLQDFVLPNSDNRPSNPLAFRSHY